ncbi:unnamed protein product [Fusarium graminearum]|nr:unnamed protein product [Fusarium graminearum]
MQSAGKFATLHQVLAWSRGLVAEGEEQVSHLCGKPACLIAEHVVIKNATQNNGRKGCGITVPCPHGDSCPLWITTCRHNPPCPETAIRQLVKVEENHAEPQVNSTEASQHR